MRLTIIFLISSLCSLLEVKATPTHELFLYAGKTAVLSGEPSASSTIQYFKIIDKSLSEPDQEFIVHTAPLSWSSSGTVVQQWGSWFSIPYGYTWSLQFGRCYEIHALDEQPGDPVLNIRFNSYTNPATYPITIYFNQVTRQFTVMGMGNALGGWTLNPPPCRICYTDLLLDNEPNYGAWLTESDTYIETMDVTIDPSKTVRFDVPRQTGYILLGPDFLSSPSSSGFFLAWPMDGCGNKIPNKVHNIIACDSYNWAANNSTYTISGYYTATLLNIVTGEIETEGLNLQLGQSGVITSNVVACDSYTWPVSGITYTSSGTYYSVDMNTSGCPDASTLLVTINTATTSNQSVTSCGTYTWPVNGMTYSASGNYTATSLNAQGCLNTATLNLTITSSCNTILNLQAFIQGYINGNVMNPVLQNQGQLNTSLQCDSIEVELHQSISPFATLYSTTALLGTNGIATCTFPSAVNSGNYYIVIKHRNAVETWSANPVNFSGTSVSYNFSNAANMAYGSNQTQVAPGVWAIYSGDLNHDENLDLLDGAALENDINNFLFGYLATDINGDGNVDLLDLPIVEENVNNFIFSAHP